MATAEEIRAAKLGQFNWKERIIDLNQLLSKAPDPIRYPVDPLVARGFVTTLAGAADVGKSLTAMALAVAGGQQRSYLAGMGINGGRCVLLDAENGPMLMHHRLWDAAAKATDLVLVNTLGLHVVDHQAHFKQLLSDQKADWAILDSLRRHTPGMDENDSGDMTSAYNALADVARDLQVGLLVIHHSSPKSIHAYRGSTAIRDQTDSLFALEHVKDDPDTKRLRLKADKYRWAEHPPTCWVRIGRDDENRLTLLEADPYEGGGAEQRDSAPSAMQLLVTARGVWSQLGSDWWARGALAALLGVPTNQGTFQDMLDLATATGDLVHNGKQTRATRYRINANGHNTEQDEWVF